jgi:hypothetical protein
VARLEERIYDLARDSLAEQERQVNEIRSRGATLLAAAAVVASLFARSVLDGLSEGGWVFNAVALVGVLGAAGALASTVLLLRPSRAAFSVTAGESYRAVWDRGITDQPQVDLTLAHLFEERRGNTATVVARLERTLDVGLGALVLETAGLAIAAGVAS